MEIQKGNMHTIADCKKKLCFGLQSDDKMVRKRALKEFESFLKSKHNLTHKEFHEIFKDVHIHLLNTLRDRSEAVREYSIQCLRLYILEILPQNDYYLSYLFPIFVERIGNAEIIEESEELRLQLVKFLIEIIDYYLHENYLKAFLNDFIIILKGTVQDRFSEIKEASCQCIIKLAKALPRDFHLQCENLVKPVLTAFGHQRFKVRLEAIKAMGDIVLHSSYKALEEVSGPMAERLFDPIPKVRQMVQQVAARWLMEYRDRYSFFYKLLPLILTGLNDEIDETRQQAHKLWLEIGLQYQQENVKDLKDQLDYLTEAPINYPKEHTRPNLGCRVLVQSNVGKLVPPLTRELCSWQTDVRIRCSQLLCAIALHAEGGLTQHLQDILMALYAGAKDEDPVVVANIIKASEIMATFVPVDTWQKLILPILYDCPHYGHLAILAAFIRGTAQENISSSLVEISEMLADKNICFSRKKQYQKELINCAQALQSHSDKSTDDVALFKIYVTVWSIADVENAEFGVGLLDSLQTTLGCVNAYELWHLHTGGLLMWIRGDPKSWTVTTIERCIFETILLNCGECFGEQLPLILDILRQALHPDADAEARLQTFVALSGAFDNKDVIFKRHQSAFNLNAFLESIVTYVLAPSLVWHAGRTSETMRTIAASCLYRVLNPGLDVNLFAKQENMRSIFNQLLPLLLSLLEDASYKSRFLAIENLVLIKQEMVRKKEWCEDDLLKVYPEIVKRLDDPTEQVRFCAIKSLLIIFKDVPLDFRKDNFKGHHQLLLDTLLIHFDDDNEEYQQLVFDVLKTFADICRETVQDKVERHRALIRNQVGCDEVFEYLKKINL